MTNAWIYFDTIHMHCNWIRESVCVCAEIITTGKQFAPVVAAILPPHDVFCIALKQLYSAMYTSYLRTTTIGLTDIWLHLWPFVQARR